MSTRENNKGKKDKNGDNCLNKYNNNINNNYEDYKILNFTPKNSDEIEEKQSKCSENLSTENNTIMNGNVKYQSPKTQGKQTKASSNLKVMENKQQRTMETNANPPIDSYCDANSSKNQAPNPQFSTSNTPSQNPVNPIIIIMPPMAQAIAPQYNLNLQKIQQLQQLESIVPQLGNSLQFNQALMSLCMNNGFQSNPYLSNLQYQMQNNQKLNPMNQVGQGNMQFGINNMPNLQQQQMQFPQMLNMGLNIGNMGSMGNMNLYGGINPINNLNPTLTTYPPINTTPINPINNPISQLNPMSQLNSMSSVNTLNNINSINNIGNMPQNYIKNILNNCFPNNCKTSNKRKTKSKLGNHIFNKNSANPREENVKKQSLNNQNNQKKKEKNPNNEINDQTLRNIKEGKELRTTVRIKNIPSRFTTEDTVILLNNYLSVKESERTRPYDLIYLPPSKKPGANIGYAFVNFVDPRHIVNLVDKLQGVVLNEKRQKRKCTITFADFQGKDEFLKNHKNETSSPTLFNDTENSNKLLSINYSLYNPDKTINHGEESEDKINDFGQLSDDDNNKSNNNKDENNVNKSSNTDTKNISL